MLSKYFITLSCARFLMQGRLIIIIILLLSICLEYGNIALFIYISFLRVGSSFTNLRQCAINIAHFYLI